MNILALESSTTSAKAMLYDTSDHTYTIEAKAYPQYFGDATLHDAESVFLETATLGKKLCAGKRVDAVTLGGTWHSVLLCDADFRPVTPVYQWSNTEPAEICSLLRKDEQYTRGYYQRTGCMVNAIYPSFKLRMLRAHGFPLEAYFIADQGTYNAFRLTGEKTVTASMLSGEGFLNVNEQRLDRTVLNELGIGERNFARIVAHNESHPLTAKGAALLGTVPGIPVLPACPDGALNQIGAGALRRGIMTISVGTSGALRVATPNPVLPEIPSIWCYLAPETWLSGAAISGCCNCVDWYKNTMFGSEITYEQIERELDSEHSTPVFLPFLFGERCPGWRDERLGGFSAVTPLHSRYHFYHGVLEGILFNLYQCYLAIRTIHGVPKRVKLSGGIVHSPFWLQMCADIFGLEMEVDDAAHGSLMGAVALGLEKLGVLGKLTDFATEPRQTILPNANLSSMYEKKYERYLYYYQSFGGEIKR
ncbi:MAG: FGGY-family carbohydrate kinase [Clostridia bacterium]|nr:FGGY-family carbohydrate kinase [Clostridia bacterium]